MIIHLGLIYDFKFFAGGLEGEHCKKPAPPVISPVIQIYHVNQI